MERLPVLYKKRFEGELSFRMAMWKTLCESFFQRYVSAGTCVIDVGAGYCEFINNIKCGRKIAVDCNEDTKKFASSGVEVISADATDMKAIADETGDIVFVSHLFEHLAREDILKTMTEMRRILKPDGRLLVLQPNIRYCYRDYWMFLDHITPLDDRSIGEALTMTGFEVVECRRKFLPYTTKSKLKNFVFLLNAYLKMPLAQYIFGQQAFIVAKKEK